MKNRSFIYLLMVVFLTALFWAIPAQAVDLNVGAQQYNVNPGPAVQYGGAGINAAPFNSSQSTYIDDLGNQLIANLTITPRFDNAAVGFSNNGVYTVQAGNDAAHGKPNYAIWNIDLATHVIGDATAFANYVVTFSWTNLAAFNSFVIPIGYQDSYNEAQVHMNIAGQPFNPNVASVYQYALDVLSPRNQAGIQQNVLHMAVQANVVAASSVPDGGTTALFLGISLAAVFAFKARGGKQLGTKSFTGLAAS